MSLSAIACYQPETQPLVEEGEQEGEQGSARRVPPSCVVCAPIVRPLLIALLMLATAYPAMIWLVDEPMFGKLLVVELWLSFIAVALRGALDS